MLQVEATALPEVRIITPKRFGDHRGFFSETYNRQAFAEAGITLEFVQDKTRFPLRSARCAACISRRRPSRRTS